MNPFYRLAPFIQEYIYRNGWTQLRAIQVAACEVIFESDSHLLLSASTASGKTEAAFFPVLTQLTEDPPASVGVLYIGPLKALINDQFLRLNDLCAEADIPVFHWHGDVNRSHKDKLMKNPRGILQITPESLESLLMHRHTDMVRLFGDLRYVIVDEVHAMMRCDRGGQVQCLLERLNRMAGCDPRRIGLSATIGDLKAAGEWLAAGTNRPTAAPRIDVKGARWRLSVSHFPVLENEDETRRAKRPEQEPYLAAPSMPRHALRAEDEEPEGALNAPELAEMHFVDDSAVGDPPPEKADPGYGYLFRHTAGHKALIFCNSREECEAVTSTLRRYCEEKREPERFLIHHGNLSASYRETAEERMKDDTLTFTTVTTSTLELGIDIGRLERAFQLDAPFTVSSFLQRMGRTGRRGGVQEMRFVIREPQQVPRAPVQHHIPWKLLQSIALIQLYLEEHWVEPPRTGKLPYSLLYHQTMSILASAGELTPAQLASRVLTLSAFRNVSADDFRTLLRYLLEIDHLQWTETRGLIIGMAGAKVVNHFKFLAVFREDEEYAVRWESNELGTIVMPPPVGERVAIAGRVWEVKELDLKRRVLYVEPVKGQVPAYFGLCPGDIHTRILERMRQVLAEDDIYPYLQKNAAVRLVGARHAVRQANLQQGTVGADGTFTGSEILPAGAGGSVATLMPLGGDSWCLTPWLGTYAFLALERFLKRRCAAALGLTAMDAARPYFIQFRMKADGQRFWQVIREEASKGVSGDELLYDGEVPIFEKYDGFVPEELIRKGFARGVLDVKGMLERMAPGVVPGGLTV